MRSLISRYGKPVLTGLSILAVCALLFATLWPFTPHPPNEVSWLANEDGVQFGDYATIFGNGEFPQVSAKDDKGFSLEFWMRPGLSKDTNVMVAFYAPGNPWQFAI